MNVLRTYGTALRIPWTPRFSDRGSNGKAIRLDSRVERRFPPPWSVEELDACYVVRDHDGQQLAFAALGQN